MIIVDDLEAFNVGDAEELIAHVYLRPRFRESRMPFRFRQSVRGDDQVNRARFQLNSYAEIEVDIDGVVGVGHLTSGAYRATSDDVDIDPQMPFVLRPGEARSWSEGIDLTMINLSLTDLERFATGDEATGSGLRFDGVAPITSDLGRHWSAVVATTRTMFDEPDLLRNDLIRRRAVDLLLSTALLAFPIKSVDTSRTHGNVLPAAVRRAMAFIEENAGSPIGVTEIARAARLSPRGLQSAFQSHVGISPAAALRRVRLDAVHEALLRGDPTTTSVAEIARRWGFHHLGRFAGTYHDEYGEHPNQTLRR